MVYFFFTNSYVILFNFTGFCLPIKLSVHLKKSHNEDTWCYNCKFCDKKFDKTSSLKDHINSQHKKSIKHQCDQCKFLLKRKFLKIFSNRTIKNLIIFKIFQVIFGPIGLKDYKLTFELCIKKCEIFLVICVIRDLWQPETN